MNTSKRILIADDNVDAADSLAMVLEYLGYEARAVYDGKQAVDVAKDFVPDLVVLDINMPVMDGYEAARTLRSVARRRVILVALTGVPNRETNEKARSNGFDAHFGKPMDTGQLDQLLQLVPP